MKINKESGVNGNNEKKQPDKQLYNQKDGQTEKKRESLHYDTKIII